MLDNLASKMGTMILLNTITQFMNYCIDEKIEPILEANPSNIYPPTLSKIYS